MAERSAIEWCDATFNPWIGCTKVSRAETGGGGCDNCYAEVSTPARVLRAKGSETWGPGAPRVRTSAATWMQPLRWNGEAFWQCTGCGWRGDDGDIRRAETTCCDHPVLEAARRRVFCASLADVFDNEVPSAWREDLLDLIERTPNLDWLLLTKRIGNVKRMLDELDTQLPPHVWLGATVVNQEEADRDIPKLLATRAMVRFLSMEPLLGPVDLRAHLYECCGCPVEDTGGEFMGQIETVRSCCGNFEGTGLHWVIVGGESGHGARPLHSELIRILRDQCAEAGVPFLFKQWGEFMPGDADCDDPVWPDVPESRLYWIDGTKWDRHDGQRPGVSICARVGKKAAGRLLDGVTHDGFPEVP